MSDDVEDSDSEATGAQVRALLGAAGLTVPEPEIERLADLYPGLRRSIDRFYEVDTGDEVTAAVFRAEDGRS